LREAIIASSRVPWIRGLYRKASQAITWEVGRRLASMRGVEAVYTRHSHPRFPTFAPGQSDLDLTVVLADDAQDPALVRACSDRVDSLSRAFPFVFPQDARFISRRELAQMEGWPGVAEILAAPSSWIRIGGREVRNESALPTIDRGGIVLHPEFNAWWLNVMQTHVLTPSSSLAEGHMRMCYRIAMKSRLHLQSARGRRPLPTQGYLPDSEAETLFRDDVAMARLLSDLGRDRFRARDGERLKSKILRQSLADAAEFYRELEVPADAAWVASVADRSPSLPEAHRSELKERLGAEEALHSIAESIIIYPTPHWAPREYQIDLIMRDEMPAAAFADAVRVIRKSFGGRTFGIGGTHAQLTMIPRRAFAHPRFFLGTPFPFLHGHLVNFAETLFGTPPRIPAPPPRAELLRWCAQYFLYHRFTLHYRPGYVSKDCNFCQLAAVRLFLEQGVVLTDATQVRDAYVRAFVTREEESAALDLLLRTGSERLDEKSFANALRLQSREYDAVEALLRPRC
jgi:hypothetical protein